LYNKILWPATILTLVTPDTIGVPDVEPEYILNGPAALDWFEILTIYVWAHDEKLTCDSTVRSEHPGALFTI
jgi:hypothetical protein